MARLIPRKQIEEQQNISGSLNIGQDVVVGNDAIISGSLFVSKSFFLGNNLNDRSEITGSVFLTGSLTIDGILKTAAPNTILSVTSSNTLDAVDTQRYAGILAKDFGANLPTLYVSSTDGDDNNDGRTIQYPLRTIKRAASLASPGYDGRYGFDTGSISNGYVIKVQAGTYLEDNPVILPKNTTIWGAGLRITKINAKTPYRRPFLGKLWMLYCGGNDGRVKIISRPNKSCKRICCCFPTWCIYYNFAIRSELFADFQSREFIHRTLRRNSAGWWRSLC